MDRLTQEGYEPDCEKCSVCRDECLSAEAIATPCGHYWCPECTVGAFKRAAQHERAYPPQCCKSDGPIPLVDVMHLFDGKSVRHYMKREKEYQCPRAARLYCANRNCSKWIPPGRFGVASPLSAVCRSCGSSTCIKCKEQMLPDAVAHICGKNEVEETFRQHAQENHLQQCYSCGSIVELAEACNHIACTECKAEFCYICAKPWPGKHGCPAYNQPVYDKDGYNQLGFHRDTQLDRRGRDFWGFNADGYDRMGLHRVTRLDKYGRPSAFAHRTGLRGGAELVEEDFQDDDMDDDMDDDTPPAFDADFEAQRTPVSPRTMDRLDGLDRPDTPQPNWEPAPPGGLNRQALREYLQLLNARSRPVWPRDIPLPPPPATPQGHLPMDRQGWVRAHPFRNGLNTFHAPHPTEEWRLAVEQYQDLLREVAIEDDQARRAQQETLRLQEHGRRRPTRWMHEEHAQRWRATLDRERQWHVV